MAVVTVLAATDAQNAMSMHPFFSKEHKRQHQGCQIGKTQNEHDFCSDGETSKTDTGETKRRQARRREQRSIVSQGQKTLQDVLGCRSIVDDAALPEITHGNTFDVNDSRRKRRRTSFDQSAYRGCETGRSHVCGSGTNNGDGCSDFEGRLSVPKCDPDPPFPPAALSDESTVGGCTLRTPPKKLLTLNASGKLTSPPSKRIQPGLQEHLEPSARERGRPRKAIAAKERKSLIVRIPYGEAQLSKTDIARRITHILSGDVTLFDTPERKLKASSTHALSKPTHPFFTGNPKQAQPNDQPMSRVYSPRKVSASTPGKLRMQAFKDKVTDIPDNVPWCVTSELLRDRHMVKHPGAQDAPFPPKGYTHVRGFHPHENGRSQDPGRWEFRKHKDVRLPMSRNKSIMSHYIAELKAEADPPIRADGFTDPHPSMKIPKQLRLAGETIAEKVFLQLSDSCTAKLKQALSSNAQGAHDAIEQLWRRIPSTFTAYDESQGENRSWAQKFSPSCASEVLQQSKKMDVLKTWLKTLTVQAVEGSVPVNGSAISSRAQKSQRRKKKTASDLDDFLVGSDDDEYDVDELELSEDELAGAHSVPKSIVRATNDKAKVGHAILISGPHGCGKTAAAYAVAKELNYRVFEINPSEKRSGRDLVDKIGNMTANHLVKHHGAVAPAVQEEMSNDIDDAFQRDLDSGKQGRMNAFFKPQPNKKSKATGKKNAPEATQSHLVPNKITAPKSAKDQQQSLILLEEVDVLFKDDKEFWPTVLKLMATSKRPIIMTCNDEDLVPLQAMSLHAVLRFAAPPLQLATDYMLLLAGAEGHLLQRDAVQGIYQTKGFDLRASIMELDYWCQMGVGDPRGGLSWIFQRWPPGSDVDDKDRKLRTVSDGTYQKNMGFTPSHELDIGCALEWAWDNFQISPTQALGWHSNLCCQSDVDDYMEDSRGRTSLLQFASQSADALSAADILYSFDFDDRIALDSTQPDISDKTRHQYIDGMVLLQTDERMDYSDLSPRISTFITLAADQRTTSFVETPLAQSALSHSMSKNISSYISTKKWDSAQLSRHDLACFDPISVASETNSSTASIAGGLSQSAFDGTLRTIVLDLAPYVRSIVRTDIALEEQRERLGTLLSSSQSNASGGKPARTRTTRAARSALEGSQRATTRRERWFTKDLNLPLVLATGGGGWPDRTFSDCGSDVDIQGTASAASSAANDDGPPSNVELGGS